MPYLIGIHLSLMEVSWRLSSPDLSTCGFVLLCGSGKDTVSGFTALHMGACRSNTSRTAPSQVHRAEHSAETLSTGLWFPVFFHFAWRLSIFMGEGVRFKEAGGRGSSRVRTREGNLLAFQNDIYSKSL